MSARQVRCTPAPRGVTPNTALMAEGSKDTLETSEKVLNIDCQKLFIFGKNQNM